MPSAEGDGVGTHSRQDLVQLRAVTKVYERKGRKVVALAGIDFDIREGEFVGIVGPSGSGKSTCAHIVGCLDQPTSGTCRIAGLDTARLDAQSRALLRRELVSFVFQEFHLMNWLHALSNVELPLVYRDVSAADRRRQAIQALRKVGLENRMHHLPAELSGGQQQRVSIARAIVTKPKLIIADEPTGALDGKTRDEILTVLAELNRYNKVTIVVVTHDPEVAAAADRVIRFDSGTIASDTPQGSRRAC